MRKILLVEDESVLRETYEMILSTQPYQIDVAENGRIAIQKCQDAVYDLILLDLMMPELDGVGFLKRYKEEIISPARIVILSNLSSGQELEEALQLGAERNVLKANMSPRQLLSMVRYELEAV